MMTPNPVTTAFSSVSMWHILEKKQTGAALVSERLMAKLLP